MKAQGFSQTDFVFHLSHYLFPLCSLYSFECQAFMQGFSSMLLSEKTPRVPAHSHEKGGILHYQMLPWCHIRLILKGSISLPKVLCVVMCFFPNCVILLKYSLWFWHSGTYESMFVQQNNNNKKIYIYLNSFFSCNYEFENSVFFSKLSKVRTLRCTLVYITKLWVK